MKVQNSRKRWWFWLPMLGFAAWLAVFGDNTPTTPSDTVNARSLAERNPGSSALAKQRAETPTNFSAKIDLDILLDRDQLYPSDKSQAAAHDLFASSSWSPPSPRPAAAPIQHPAAPIAPALPFIYIGKKLEGSVWEIYVTRGQQSFILRKDTLIDNTYRVQSITPPNLSLIYLPLGQTQTLAIGESQ